MALLSAICCPLRGSVRFIFTTLQQESTVQSSLTSFKEPVVTSMASRLVRALIRVMETFLLRRWNRTMIFCEAVLEMMSLLVVSETTPSMVELETILSVETMAMTSS